ncbi:histidine kinase [Micromonospora schwarzwaldensis]
MISPLAATALLGAYPMMSVVICAATSLAAGLAIRESVPVWSAALGAALFVISLLAGHRAPRPMPALAVLGVAALLDVAYGLAAGGGPVCSCSPWSSPCRGRSGASCASRTSSWCSAPSRPGFKSARIAHDMHDTLGHELSLLALRAAALEMAPELDDRHRAVMLKPRHRGLQSIFAGRPSRPDGPSHALTLATGARTPEAGGRRSVTATRLGRVGVRQSGRCCLSIAVGRAGRVLPYQRHQ